MIAKKVEEIRDSPSKMYNLLYKSKQKRKISFIKTATRGNSKFFDAVVGTNILNKLRPISA